MAVVVVADLVVVVVVLAVIVVVEVVSVVVIVVVEEVAVVLAAVEVEEADSLALELRKLYLKTKVILLLTKVKRPHSEAVAQKIKFLDLAYVCLGES